MNIESAFPSNYLKASEVGEEGRAFTINHVEIETIGQGKEAEQKPIVFFKETDKGLVLNKTNKSTIVALYGAETDDWTGKRVTVYATDVEFKGEMVQGIRIKTKAPASASNVPPASNAQAMRVQAWKAFQAARPGKDVDALTPEWQALLKSVGNGTPSNEFTGIEWTKVKSRAVPLDDPAQNEPVFESDDIPL